MAGEWNEFRCFVYGTGLALRKGEKALGREQSHLLLDGGIIICPPDRQREFNKKYAEALYKDVKVFCVEMKTKHAFYMMTEFDLKLRDRTITEDELKTLVSIIQRIIVTAFPNEDHILAVLVAPQKSTTLKDGSSAIQSGVHLIWKIPITLDTAWMLRAWILRELDEKTSGIPWVESWQEMYDSCIFKDNGLRMIGSNKAIICPSCKGKSFRRDDGQVCLECRNIGRVDQGRPYKLLFVANSAGLPDEALTTRYKQPENILELVELCGIRVMPDRNPVPIIGDITFDMMIKIEQWVKVDRKQAVVKKPLPRQEQEQKSKSSDRDSLIELMPETLEYRTIAAYIFTEFNGAPIATHIKKTKAGDVYIINSKCRWCANKGGEHAHSNVYYILSPKGCAQKCFCSKTQNGGVCCLKYTSKLHKVPIETLSCIFNDALLNVRRKQEKRLKLAEAVFSKAGSFAIPGDDIPTKPRDQAHPYRGGNGIVLPVLKDGAAEQLRRKGIQKKLDYDSIKLGFTPRFDPDNFFDVVQGASFNLFR